MLGQQKVREKGTSKFASVLSLATELGFSISLPIVGGAFLGRFLDERFNSSPKMTLSLIFFGVFISIANIYFVLKKIKEE